MSMPRRKPSVLILEITHSDPAALISSLSDAGIVLLGVELIDEKRTKTNETFR